MARVLIVDDHPVVRTGMKALLGTAEGLEVVGAAANAAETLDLVEQLSPDVVLTDLRLGDDAHDGVWITEQLTRRTPPIAVVVLTTYDHDRDLVRAVEAGAAGYLLKDADPDTIIAAVSDAAKGLDVLGDDQTQRVVDAMRERRVELSDREREVLAEVATGASNREVARALNISEATVKTHLVRAFSKLQAESRTGAIARARDLGLID